MRRRQFRTELPPCAYQKWKLLSRTCVKNDLWLIPSGFFFLFSFWSSCSLDIGPTEWSSDFPSFLPCYPSPCAFVPFLMEFLILTSVLYPLSSLPAALRWLTPTTLGQDLCVATTVHLLSWIANQKCQGMIPPSEQPSVKGSLAFFSRHISLERHPVCCVDPQPAPFRCLVIFHTIVIPQLV